MSLVKTSVLNGIATAIRVATSIGLNKVFAVHVGPAGFSLIGQFSNVVTVASSLAGGAVGNGVTKYTAEYFDQPARRQDIWRAAALYLLIATLISSSGLWVFSEPLARSLLGDAGYKSMFVLLALTLPLIAFNGLLLAIMNGLKEVRSYVVQNIASSLLGALVSAALAMRFGVNGALAALAVNQAIVLVVTLWLCRRAGWISSASFIGSSHYAVLRSLLGYALMALTSAVAGPVAQMLVRDHLMDSFGGVAAGEWQAVFKISDIYLMLFTATLTVYYLPRLSEIRDSTQLFKEIRKVYAFVLPGAVAAAGVIYLLREWITVTLFTKDFVGMVNLFAWQLAGDVLKIGSWILAFVMVGRAMVRWFVATEILFSASWVLLTVLFTPYLGVNGAPAGFACNYALYWLFMGWLVRYELKKMKS